jgi:hypothetical protein
VPIRKQLIEKLTLHGCVSDAEAETRYCIGGVLSKPSWRLRISVVSDLIRRDRPAPG